MEKEKKVEVRERKDREGCFTANGILVCRCGKCELEDYKLPEDFDIISKLSTDKI